MHTIKTMILISVMSMCWWRNHIIMMLLSLELLLLSSFMIFSSFSKISFSFTLLIFLTTMVIASSMGLSILISISRTHKSSMSSNIAF